MDEKNKKNKIKIFVITVILIAVVATAIITACILHAKRLQLDDLNDKTGSLPNIEAVQLFENF